MFKQSILERYVAKEVLISTIGVFIVLLLIISSSQLAHQLSRAAEGGISNETVFPVLINTSIRFSIQLMPVSFFLGILLAFGRLYKDNEMAAMNACGVGTFSFIRALSPIIVSLFLIVGIANFFLAPALITQFFTIKADLDNRNDLTGLVPGRFNEIKGENPAIFYLERQDDEGRMYNVFLRHSKVGQDVFTEIAPRAHSYHDPKNRRFVVFENGKRYTGMPGEAEYKIISFKEHGLYMKDEGLSKSFTTRRELPTLKIWNSSELNHRVEMEWRFTLPIAVIVLSILAIPLSYTSPRKGRFSRMPLGIFIYLLYANMLVVGLNWMEKGMMPSWLGLWWVHLIVLMITLYMIIRRNGGFKLLFNKSDLRAS